MECKSIQVQAMGPPLLGIAGDALLPKPAIILLRLWIPGIHSHFLLALSSNYLSNPTFHDLSYATDIALLITLPECWLPLSPPHSLSGLCCLTAGANPAPITLNTAPNSREVWSRVKALSLPQTGNLTFSINSTENHYVLSSTV